MIPGIRQRTEVIPINASFLDETTDERFFIPNIFLHRSNSKKMYAFATTVKVDIIFGAQPVDYPSLLNRSTDMNVGLHEPLSFSEPRTELLEGSIHRLNWG